eukprot:evm.model.scf_993.2 EVM.evm.TU.scf_993.2   scf_993:10236-15555(-)
MAPCSGLCRPRLLGLGLRKGTAPGRPGRLVDGSERSAGSRALTPTQPRIATSSLASRFLSYLRSTSGMGVTELVMSDVLEVHRVPCLVDNYAWLLHEPKAGLTAIVDPSEVQPVVEALRKTGYNLDYIINTHHHWDHTGGNIALKDKYGCRVVGPDADRSRIPRIDISLKDGETWKFGELDMVTFDTPGHTMGHMSVYFPEAAAVFTGDTLFAMGCGRLFEGTAQQMWASLSRLSLLPPETKVFCGHEYTQANARFAISVDSENPKLIERKKVVDEMRSKGLATVPCTIAEERDTNPFLRAPDAAVRAKTGVPSGAPDAEAFAAVRRAKDSF